MSIATEISRITSNRNTIRNKLVNFGLAESTATLNDLATTIDAIVNRGTVNAEVQEGQSYTIQAGYYQGGTVSGVSGGGNYTLQSKTITPTKAQQNITPDSGYYGLNSVTVNAIPAAYQDVSAVDATAADVLANKVIVTADGTITTGTMNNNGAVDVTLDKDNRSYTVPAGYHNGLGTVVVDSDLIDTTDADAVAGEILSGKTAYVNGVKVTGTMVNNGAIAGTFDGLTTTSYSVPAGYTSGGTVSLTNDIETALAAI